MTHVSRVPASKETHGSFDGDEIALGCWDCPRLSSTSPSREYDREIEYGWGLRLPTCDTSFM